METIGWMILAALVLTGMSFAGISIKLLVKKRGEFKRPCASADPYTGRRSGCACAHRTPSPRCAQATHYHPLEVNDELLREAGVVGGRPARNEP